MSVDTQLEELSLERALLWNQHVAVDRFVYM